MYVPENMSDFVTWPTKPNISSLALYRRNVLTCGLDSGHLTQRWLLLGPGPSLPQEPRGEVRPGARGSKGRALGTQEGAYLVGAVDRGHQAAAPGCVPLLPGNRRGRAFQATAPSAREPLGMALAPSLVLETQVLSHRTEARDEGAWLPTVRQDNQEGDRLRAVLTRRVLPCPGSLCDSSARHRRVHSGARCRPERDAVARGAGRRPSAGTAMRQRPVVCPGGRCHPPHPTPHTRCTGGGGGSTWRDSGRPNVKD